MDINRVLFGHLTGTKGIEHSFEDLDVNHDGVINEKDKTLAGENQALTSAITILLNEPDSEENVEILADFVAEDTAITENIGSKAQTAVILTQLEITKLNDKQVEIQKEAEKKQKEMESKQKKIEAKQKEYEFLVKEAQNNNDNSKVTYITDLQVEIKFLSNEVEEIKLDIEDLERKYDSNVLLLSSLNMTLEQNETKVIVSDNAQQKNNIQSNLLSDDTYTEETVNSITGEKETCVYDKKTKRILSKTETYHVDANNPDKYKPEKKVGKGTDYDVTHTITYQYNDDGSYIEITRDTRNGRGIVGCGKKSISETTVKKYDSNGNEVKNNASMKTCLGSGASVDTKGRIKVNPVVNKETYQYKNEIKTEGTSFVVFASSGCGLCQNMHSYLTDNPAGQEQIQQLDLMGINIVWADSSDGGVDEAAKIAKSLNVGVNEETGNVGLPIIVKYENGKPTGIVDCFGITVNSKSFSDYLLNNVVSERKK